jgi:hypothetical protein
MASINAKHTVSELGITVTTIVTDDGDDYSPPNWCKLNVRCNAVPSSKYIWTISFTDYDGAHFRYRTDALPIDKYLPENVMHFGIMAALCKEKGHGWESNGKSLQDGFTWKDIKV